MRKYRSNYNNSLASTSHFFRPQAYAAESCSTADGHFVSSSEVLVTSAVWRGFGTCARDLGGEVAALA